MTSDISSKEKFWNTPTTFLFGMLVGALLIGLVTYFPFIMIWADLLVNPVTINDCAYGLHSEFLLTRCITETEMKLQLGCSYIQTPYLRDGYWWECISSDWNCQAVVGSLTCKKLDLTEPIDSSKDNAK